MSVDPGPHDGGRNPVVFTPSGRAVVKTFTPGFYEELDAEFASFAGHVLIQRYAFEKAWPTWEMHPKGDEYVYLLSGDVDFVLWQGGAETVLRVSEAGAFVVVPRGVWHTARPHTPTAMLFVTPGEGTQNAETPG